MYRKVITFITLVLLSFAEFGYAEDTHVLVLNSYHPQYVWSSDQANGIQDTLSKVIPLENIHVEFLDTRRFFDDAEYEKFLVELIRYKYTNQLKISLLITNEDFALKFAMRHYKELFDGVPVVFNGVNGDFSQELQNRPNFTGIYEGLDIESNVELIKSIHPDSKKIVFLADKTSSGSAMKDRAYRDMRRWESENRFTDLEFLLWDDYSLNQLYTRVTQAESDTVFLILAIHADNLGTYFSYHEHLPVLSEKSPRPIYAMWGPLVLGYGVVGGYMVSPYNHGVNAANMGIKILGGTAPNEIPIIEKAQFTPHFDFNQMQRFDLNENKLPKNSNVINTPVKNYEKLLKLFFTVCAFMCISTLFCLILVTNIRRRIKAENQLSYLAYHDEMTGLGNKNSLTKALNILINLKHKKNVSFILTIIDIDGFKYLNDNLGQIGGDVLLRLVAKRISELAPSPELTGRFGGDEFYTIFTHEGRDIKDAFAVFANDLFQEPFEYEGEKFLLRAHIGAALSSTQGQNSEQLIKRAEAAMYESKRHPELEYYMYSSAVTGRWNERLSIEAQIHDALEHNRLSLHFQPKVDSQTSNIIGAEALIRMKLPHGETLSPADFIPIAEQSHLIRPINRWVIDKVFSLIEKWHSEGLGLIPISINISCFSLYQKEIAEYLKSKLEKHSHIPQWIELELTESTLINDLESARSSLIKINNMGFSISIDDFGTGWSNLGYLKKLPIHALKIDRGFILNIDKDEKEVEMVKAIHSMALSIDAETIIEGVETQEQLTSLQDIGCNLIQGYLFYRPMSLEKFEALMDKPTIIHKIY